jgi:phospholipid/cholesterol/gamma-HCH transport system substrate-binding protein
VKQTSTELKVGIFAIIVIIFLSYITFKVGGLPLLWEKGYRLYVTLDDITGLDEQSRVKIAGVDTGVVEKIALENGKARLTLLINPNVVIYENAIASLKMSGLLGDKYISISTGTPDYPVLANGAELKHVMPASDIGALANQLAVAARNIADLTRNIEDIFGQEEKEALKASILDLRVVTQNLKNISTENREPLNSLIAQLNDFSSVLSAKGPKFMDDISMVAQVLGERGPALIDSLDKTASELREVIGENKENLRESIENMKYVSKSARTITRKIEEGEGTIGKLMKEDGLYTSLEKVSNEAGKSFDVINRLRTFMDFHSEYNTGEAEWKGYFDLTLQPKDDQYYILGVVSDPKGSVERTETRIINGSTIEEEEIKRDKIEFSVQFAKRFEDFALRIGLMENTFGVGADYFFLDDSGRVKFDVWDFGGDEAGADDAHARIGVDYRLFKYLFISAGYDNLLNSNRAGIYVGGGLKFEDKDLKYLLGTFPIP